MSVFRHTAFNFVGSALPIAFSLITVPLYLSYIGPERYGVLAITWLTLGYFGLFDLGLGRATAQKIATLREDQRPEQAATFWSALGANLVMGLIGAALLWIVATNYFAQFFKVSEVVRAEIVMSVPLLACTLPIATVSSVLIGTLQGRQRFFQLNLIQVFSTATTQFVPLAIAIFYSPAVQVVLGATLIVRTLWLLVLGVMSFNLVARGHRARIERAQAIGLVRFGGWVTVSSVVSPLMTILDRFVIGGVSGASAVTLYSVPFQLAQRVLILPSALTEALFPRMSASLTDLDRLEISVLGSKIVTATMTVIITVGILGIEPFLYLWLGSTFDSQAGDIGRIVLIGVWANALAYIPYTQLQAKGRVRFNATVHVLELPLYLLLFFIGLKYFGLLGAAVAYTARCVVDEIIMSSAATGRRSPWGHKLIGAVLLTICLAVAELMPKYDVVYAVSALTLIVLSLAFGWVALPAPIRGVLVDRIPLMRSSANL